MDAGRFVQSDRLLPSCRASLTRLGDGSGNGSDNGYGSPTTADTGRGPDADGSHAHLK